LALPKLVSLYIGHTPPIEVSRLRCVFVLLARRLHFCSVAIARSGISFYQGRVSGNVKTPSVNGSDDTPHLPWSNCFHGCRSWSA
jgi:hypothetical protein